MALEGARISQNNGNTGLNGMDISVSKTNSGNKISDGLSTTTSTQTQTQTPINTTSYQRNVEVEELDLTETTQPEQNVVNEVEEDDGNILTGAISIVGDWASATVDWFGDKLNDLYHFVSEGGILEKATEAINNILSKTGATVAAIGLGLVEGICSFAEAIIDAAVILETIAFTGVAVIVDLVGKAFGKDFGFTEKLWDLTMGFVSEKWVSGAFDKFYEETEAGQWIADNSLAFDKVRSISSGIGYVAGMIALTIATCGVGTAPTITAAISSTATQGAVIAGTAGFGKGAEEAWDSGATALEGLGYASVRGVAEGVSYYFGGKMAGVTIGSGTSLGSKILTSGVRISFDTIDGGASGFIDPAAKMIYNDKNFSESFEENGGWNTVLTNAAIGGATSAAGEIADNIKIRKNNISVDVDTSTIDSRVSQYSVADISNLKNEYDELIKVTKEPWFIDAKKAMDNGFAGNLNDIAAADDIIKRINEIESTLLIESNIPQFKQKDYSQVKKQADAQSRDINNKPIPGFENIDTSSQEYKDVMQKYYSQRGRTLTPGDSPFVNQVDNIVGDKKILDSKLDTSVQQVNIDINPDEALNQQIKEQGIFRRSKKSKLDSGLNNIQDPVLQLDLQINSLEKQYSDLLYQYNYMKDSAIRATIQKHHNYSTLDEYNDLYQRYLNAYENGNYDCITKDASYRSNLFILENQLNDVEMNLSQLKETRKNLVSVFNNEKVQNFFDENNTLAFNYGVDQGIINRSYKIQNGRRMATQDYLRVKNSIAMRYNMSVDDAAKFMHSVDSVGACSYASTANEIFAAYIGRENEFINDFKMPMYVIENSQKRLNSMELLADLYAFQNHAENGGNLLLRTADGRTILNPNAISSNIGIGGRYNLDAKLQKYLSSSYGVDKYSIEAYLKSKNPNLVYNQGPDFNNFNGYSFNVEDLKNYITGNMNNGYNFRLGYYRTDKEINMYNLSGGSNSSTHIWSEGSGHSVFVTGLNNQGLIVSSWGEKYLIPFADLDGNSFILDCAIISKNR